MMIKWMVKTMVLLLGLGLAACRAADPTPTSTATPVPTLEPVGAGPLSLAGTTWSWTEFSGQEQQFAVEGSQYYLITFKEDGSVNLKADCNRAIGDYTDDNGKFVIEIGPVTRVQCVEGSRGDQFIDLLDGEALYSIDDSGDLVATLAMDRGTMVFSPAVDEEVIQDELGQGNTSIMLWSGPWQWLSFSSDAEQFEVQAPEAYQIAFNPDGTLLLAADCNIVRGEYSTEVSILSIEVGPSTLALCPGDSRSEQLIQLIERAALYYFSMDQLIIDLEDGAGTMVFQRRPTNALTDALIAQPWQWVEFTGPGDQFEIENPESYQLTFNPAGTLDVVADCNMAQGDYAVVDRGMTIALRLMTPALCPGDSRSEQFINLLPGAASYFFEGGDLYIDLMVDGGTLHFEPAR